MSATTIRKQIHESMLALVSQPVGGLASGLLKQEPILRLYPAARNDYIRQIATLVKPNFSEEGVMLYWRRTSDGSFEARVSARHTDYYAGPECKKGASLLVPAELLPSVALMDFKYIPGSLEVEGQAEIEAEKLRLISTDPVTLSVHNSLMGRLAAARTEVDAMSALLDAKALFWKHADLLDAMRSGKYAEQVAMLDGDSQMEAFAILLAFALFDQGIKVDPKAFPSIRDSFGDSALQSLEWSEKTAQPMAKQYRYFGFPDIWTYPTIEEGLDAFKRCFTEQQKNPLSWILAGSSRQIRRERAVGLPAELIVRCEEQLLESLVVEPVQTWLDRIATGGLNPKQHIQLAAWFYDRAMNDESYDPKALAQLFAALPAPLKACLIRSRCEKVRKRATSTLTAAAELKRTLESN